jgi:DNA ligase-1
MTMKNEKDMMHGIDYAGQDVSGWLASEKLNGCRAYWDGREMWTRGGKIIRIPDTMRRALPTIELDGEIHAGRTGYEIARLAVQYGRFTDAVQFSAFDAPGFHGPFEDRYQHLKGLLPAAGLVNYVEHVRCYFIEEAVRMMFYIQARKGEGVMLRNPAGIYTQRRSEQMLKLKTAPVMKDRLAF